MGEYHGVVDKGGGGNDVRWVSIMVWLMRGEGESCEVGEYHGVVDEGGREGGRGESCEVGGVMFREERGNYLVVKAWSSKNSFLSARPPCKVLPKVFPAMQVIW